MLYAQKSHKYYYLFKILIFFYSKIYRLARQITGETDNDRAMASIEAKINEPSNYFNTKSIPKGESDKEAHAKCSSMEKAKIHCPVRWEAMNNWFAYVKQVRGVNSGIHILQGHIRSHNSS